jgi:hypothetical protein
MLECERNPSDALLVEIKDKSEELMSLVEYIKEKYGVLDQGKLEKEIMKMTSPLLHPMSHFCMIFQI